MDTGRHIVGSLFRIALIAAVTVISTALFAGESSDQKPFTFVQICDTQLGMGGYEHDLDCFRQAVEQINALKPDFVVICGDLVDKANKKSFADFKTIKADLTVPCYCAAGNHDVGNEPTTASLTRYRELIGKDYYSFEHKGYSFIIVNTQLWKAPLNGESERHDSWFKKTLKAAYERRNPIIVVGHYPLYLESADEESNYFNLPPEKREELLALFERYGVVAMLGGHTHRTIINDYQGIKLVNAETTSKNFDKRPLGFRLWRVVSPKLVEHKFFPLKEGEAGEVAPTEVESRATQVLR